VLEQSMDPLRGSTARVLVTSLVGAIWVIFPLFGPYQERLFPGTEMISAAPLALLSAVVMVVVAWRWRDERTQVNHQLLSIIVFAMLVQAVFIVFFYLAVGDLGARSVPVFSGYWALISGIVAVSVIRSVWPMSLGYLTAAIGAFYLPQHRYLFSGFANLVLVVTSLILFKHERREERARATQK
jgi:hypothetical protein